MPSARVVGSVDVHQSHEHRVLLLERGEFNANIFYLVLASTRTMGEPFKSGVILYCLLKVCCAAVVSGH